MQKQTTILIGQVLQIRDKLYAKRHHIPKELQGKWQSALVEADALEPRINPKTNVKSVSFSGSLKDLKSLLASLSNLNKTVSY